MDHMIYQFASGLTIIGKQEGNKLKDPRSLQFMQDKQGLLIHFLPIAGSKKEIEISSYEFRGVCEDMNIIRGYQQAVTGLVFPDKKIKMV